VISLPERINHESTKQGYVNLEYEAEEEARSKELHEFFSDNDDGEENEKHSGE
jgi:hypothetical protein